jgi:hypothetical protein
MEEIERACRVVSLLFSGRVVSQGHDAEDVGRVCARIVLTACCSFFSFCVGLVCGVLLCLFHSSALYINFN